MELVASFGGGFVDIFSDPQRNGNYTGESFAGGVNPQGVAVADFNRDSLNDIALTNTDTLRVKIQGNNLTFTDQLFTAPNALEGGRNLVAAKLNGDDFPDVAIVDFTKGRLTVWLNSGDPDPTKLFPEANAKTLNLPEEGGVPSVAQAVTAADLNGDGIDDLIVANPTPLKNVSVFINNGDGTFKPITNYPAGFDADATAVGDFNLDGKKDIVVVNVFGVDGTNGDFCVYLGDGTGNFTQPKTFTAGIDNQTPPQPNHPRSVAVGDFNGDGKPDLVMSSDLNGSAVVVLNTSN
ncbi:MAG TPA: hypothetical protein DF383_08605 [Deltaproteobacteria bacterium]|nr:hypothetical protein [Deltaproteobacteria bacterium]